MAHRNAHLEEPVEEAVAGRRCDEVVLYNVIIIFREVGYPGVVQESGGQGNRAHSPAQPHRLRVRGGQARGGCMPHVHSHVSIQVHATVDVEERDPGHVRAVYPAASAKRSVWARK